MQYTKEDIIIEYNNLKKYLGRPPSSADFHKETSINKRHMAKLFGSNSFTKLVLACGDSPKEFFKEKSDLNEILVAWANLTKSLGKMPTSSDWIYNNCKPTIEGISKTHQIKWTDFPYKFLEVYGDKSEWKEVITLIPNRHFIESHITNAISKTEGLSYEILKYIPPVVKDLIQYSGDVEKSLEFEKKVNLVFQMLGFEVTEYGQGTGRNPDGIAKCTQYNYAIIIDAKSRGDTYKVGTEDRKFIEYINTFSEPLKKGGFKNIYLLVVSSSFDPISTIALKNIKLETQVPTTLLTSKLLLKLLSSKIKEPRLFDLKMFQELLIEDGEIPEKKIDRLITKRKTI